MLFHDGEQTFKAQLSKMDNHEEHIVTLQAKFTGNHKEMIAHQKKLKPILEGMDKKKQIKILGR